MKILLVNTSDRGGAANACIRLHLGLLASGIDSKLLLFKKTKNIPQSYEFLKAYQSSKFKAFITKLKQRSPDKIYQFFNKIRGNKSYLSQRSKKLEIFSYPYSSYDITQSVLYKEADIINLHWVVNFLDYRSFFKKNKKPVVWTLHDMNPFLGGEHYNENFLGYNLEGLPIEREFNNFELKEFNRVLRKKKKIFRNVKNLHVVSLCNWMAEEVNKSDLFKSFNVTKIPNGVNPEIFKPRAMLASREALELPKDKIILLFVADSIENNRKGYSLLLRALEKLNNDNIVLCSVGNKKNEGRYDFDVIELGEVKEEIVMSEIYSAADVFVIPSLMDNLPNTVVESLLCGTPVIGFNIGGIPDMVKHGFNGYLSDTLSPQSLANNIKLFLEHKIEFESELIRKDAVERFQLNNQVQSYKKLFDSLI